MTGLVETVDRLRILIVEDDVLIAEEIRERLSRLGFTTLDIVQTGERAIEQAELYEPELVLMDIRLKGQMDGIQAAEVIRDKVRAPVVFLTAHSDRDTLERAKESQAFGYVLKPINERELAVAIEMSLHRHGLERQLVESERRYAATLASIGDGVVATDPDGHITFMNPVAEALTQWRFTDARELVVDTVMPLVDEATKREREHPCFEAMRLTTTVGLDEPTLLVTRNGEMIPIDDSAAPIRGDTGNILGSVFAFRDIRQRRLAQDALKEAEDQLRHAQKMEAMGRLVGGIAHDFNNLLTVINGSADLVLSGEQLDDTSRALLTDVKKAGEQAAGMTRRLLAFSRKQVLSPVTLHLGQLIHDMSRMLARLIGEDIILSTASDPDLQSVKADPGQIEQVIMNLAVNARDAMPTGGRLTIGAKNVQLTEQLIVGRPEFPPGSYVLLSVSDNGVGMDQETQEHVFEPYFTTKDSGRGTGLGLATAYGIVKQSGGFIYMRSSVNEGTTFDIYFPALPEAPASTETAKSTNAAPLSGDETILLVEDDDAVRSLIASALRRHGYTVHEADGGATAVEKFEERAADIQMVVTDVVMHGMSGREVSERLRAVKSNVRILFVSGYTDDAIVRHGVSSGDVAFLQKPFTLTSLAKKVREVLDS